MKADESADCAGRWGGRLPTEQFFLFFSGPQNRKIHFKKLGFRRGSDSIMLSSYHTLPSVRLFQEKSIFGSSKRNWVWEKEFGHRFPMRSNSQKSNGLDALFKSTSQQFF
jgi:hypothetical protein